MATGKRIAVFWSFVILSRITYSNVQHLFFLIFTYTATHRPFTQLLDIYATCGKSIHRSFGSDGFVPPTQSQQPIGNGFVFRATVLVAVTNVVSVFSEVLFSPNAESPGQLFNGNTAWEARFLRRVRIQLEVGVSFLHWIMSLTILRRIGMQAAIIEKPGSKKLYR